MSRRECVVCKADLTAPGTASPLLEPDARDGPGPEWLCLDQRGCDLRWADQARASLAGHPMAWLLGEIVDVMAPQRLELER
jgi:hypothetical protein